MKKKFLPLYLFFSLAIAGIAGGNFTSFADSGHDLPIVKLLNKSFYYYEAKKGESLAGICKENGWDLATLEKYNKEVMLPLENGTMLFYPVPSNNANPTVPKANPKSGTKSDKDRESADNSGQIINAQDSIATDDVKHNIAPADDDNIYYVVKNSESMYGIARKNNLTIDELIAFNPSLQMNRPAEGDKLVIGKREIKSVSQNTARVSSDDTVLNHTSAPTEDYTLSGMTTYQALRGDTWESIAEQFEISEDILKGANPDILKVKRGEIIMIPEIQPVVEEKNDDIAEEDTEGLEVTQEVSVAIVLSDVDSNKDMEFSRGALVAVDRMKNHKYQTRLTILDGSMDDRALTDSLESFGPSYVVTTTSKTLPGYLVDYCTASQVPLINAFDVKDENYLTSPFVVQFQTPSQTFNEVVSEDIKNQFANRHVIVAGNMEPGDTMGEAIVTTLATVSGIETEEVEISGLTDLELNPGYDYVIYATPSKKEDVKVLLEKLSVLRDRNPLCDIRVIGRPSWITFADAQKEQFAMNYVYMPTRFYFDAEEGDARSFINDYKDLFGHTPLKSYPVYSATAYDIVSSITPAMNDGGAGALEQPALGNPLQSSIDLKRVSSVGGLMNTDVYVIEYMPFLPPRKRLL